MRASLSQSSSEEKEESELTLPYVQTHAQLGRVGPDPERDEEHVGHDVVEAQGYEGHDGPPHSNDLGGQILRLHAKENGQADEPVTADGAQEDLVHLRRDLFLGGEGDHLVPVRRRVEDPSIFPPKLLAKRFRL